MSQRLYLIRGLPGSGKSTRARQIVADHPGMRHIEADMYFEDREGRYVFAGGQIGNAHAWCRKKTLQALQAGHSVAVANTFTQRWEMAPYLQMSEAVGAEVVIIECTGNHPSQHGVPAAHVEKMRRRWEALA